MFLLAFQDRQYGPLVSGIVTSQSSHTTGTLGHIWNWMSVTSISGTWYLESPLLHLSQPGNHWSGQCPHCGVTVMVGDLKLAKWPVDSTLFYETLISSLAPFYSRPAVCSKVDSAFPFGFSPSLSPCHMVRHLTHVHRLIAKKQTWAKNTRQKAYLGQLAAYLVHLCSAYIWSIGFTLDSKFIMVF